MPIAAFAFLAWKLVGDESVQLQQRVLETERKAQVEARNALLLESGDFSMVEHYCSELWRDRLSIYQAPQALAWTRRGIDAYFQQGVDRYSLRLVRCDARGVESGPRIAHPLAAELPVEALDEASSDQHQNAWRLAIGGLLLTPLRGDILAIELLQRPGDGRVVRREWRGLEGGAASSMSIIGGNPDSDDGDSGTFIPQNFPLLIDRTEFPILSEHWPSTTSKLQPHHWLREPLLALDAIESILPPQALISEISLSEHQIEIQIVAQTLAFDGKPPAPFGDMELDEYGVPDRSWWYPREIPGFGCEKGRTLSEVREMFEAEGKGPQPHQAWYSCSPAFSDGQNGVWMVR